MLKAQHRREVTPRPVRTKERAVIQKLVDNLDEVERFEIMQLFQSLVDLSHASGSRIAKLKETLAQPELHRAALLILTRTATEVKDFAWDDRTWAARIGLSAATVAAATTSGQGAGIALLGTAIGVPLWVVFGAGGAFAGVVIEEIKRSLPDGYAVETDSTGSALVHIREADYQILSVEFPTRAAELVQLAAAADEPSAAPSRIAGLGRRMRDRGQAVLDRLRNR